MTESQIEMRVERMIDHLDRMLLSGSMTQKDYNLAMLSLTVWADHKAKESSR